MNLLFLFFSRLRYCQSMYNMLVPATEFFRKPCYQSLYIYCSPPTSVCLRQRICRIAFRNWYHVTFSCCCTSTCLDKAISLLSIQMGPLIGQNRLTVRALRAPTMPLHHTQRWQTWLKGAGVTRTGAPTVATMRVGSF